MPAGPLTSVGIGDDAAVIGAPSGSVVAAVDLLIEGRHFRRDWSSAYDVGVKAAARSLADIAAMGAVSTALLVALAAPGTLPPAGPPNWRTGSRRRRPGRARESSAATRRARDLVLLSVTALGDLTSRPVLRFGARPGDLVAVAGQLGRSAPASPSCRPAHGPRSPSSPNWWPRTSVPPRRTTRAPRRRCSARPP